MRRMNVVLALMAFGLAVLSSCTDGGTLQRAALGTTTYHDGFLWTEADTSFVEKTLSVVFNEDAVEKGAEVELILTDNEGAVVSPSVLQTVVDGKVLKSNRFTVEASGKRVEKKVRFRFLPGLDGAQEGEHQGYVEAVSAEVYNVNGVELSGRTKVMQWTLLYDEVMNPLKKWLLVSLVAFVALVLLARIVLHRKTFGSTVRKSITVLRADGTIDYGPRTTAFGGFSELVIANKEVEQGFLERFFRGKTKTLVCGAVASGLRLTPAGRREIRLSGSGYSITRNKIAAVDKMVEVTELASKSKVRIQ